MVREAREQLRQIPPFSSRLFNAWLIGKGSPTYPLFMQRFGTWEDLLAKAGVEREVHGRSSAVSRADAERAVLKATGILGHIPTYAEYEQLQRAHADMPSGATVRNRMGRWSDVLVWVANHAD
jgi:hypothetical protein